MKRPLIIALAVTALCASGTRAEDGKIVLNAAASALGATELKSIQISGWGFDYLFGQAYDGDSPWPRFNLPRYTLAIDFVAPAIRDERIRTQAQNPPRGGGNQPINEQRQVWSFSGGVAWNGTGQGGGAAGNERDQRSAAEGRQTQIWLTPHGFIKAALAANADVHAQSVRGAKKTVVRFAAPNHVTLTGVLNDQNLVERIETWVGAPVLGDTLFEAIFSEYRDFDGVRFPAHIVQREGGYPVLDVTITEVKPNAVVAIEVPPAVAQAKPRAPFVIQPVRLSEGIWSIPLGARDRSVAVEFLDHVVVIEAPDSEEISTAAIAAIHQAIPNKPINYVINTHTHFDHSGGLRTYAAEGATVVTDRDNVAYYEQAWANPRTIHPDRLARSGRTPTFEGVVGSRTFSDASRRLVVYHYAGNMHNPGMLMVFLPREQILVEADSFNPPNNPTEPPTAIPNLVQFVGVVERLGLDVDQLVPIHGRIATYAEALKAADTYRSTQLWGQ